MTLQDARDLPAARRLAPAVDRAMRILAMLEAEPQRAFTVSEIARGLGVAKSSAFNLCGALVEGRLLRRTRAGLQLGRGLVQLGAAYVSSVNLLGEFYEVSRAAPPDLDAVVQLAVLGEGIDAIYLAAQDCNSGLRLGLGGGVGRRVPANCTACGKALLAALPQGELDRRLAAVGELPRLTRRSAATPARLARDLAEARRTGYAREAEETIPGLACIARAFDTPHADGGRVAVSISAAADGLTEARGETIRAALDEVVDALRARV